MAAWRIRYAAPAKVCVVGVQNLAIVATVRHTDAITLVRHGSEVAYDHQVVARRLAFAQEGNDGIVGVVEVDPIEAGVLKIDLVQRWFRPAQMIQRTTKP